MCPRLSSSVIFLLFLFHCFITNGAAIKCYICDSSKDAGCADLKSDPTIEPEECTLAKIRSLDTWLIQLNKFEYFDNGAKRMPLMNCQKVVARNPNSSQLITARFCQLDTSETNACEILQSKLRKGNDNPLTAGRFKRDYQQQQQRNNGYGKDNNETPEEEFFCNICKEDLCNGAASVTLTSLLPMGLLIILQQLLPRPLCC